MQGEREGPCQGTCIEVGKLDIDGSNQTAVRFSVSTIPTVLLFNKGEVVERFVGLKSKKDYEDAINKLTSAG